MVFLTHEENIICAPGTGVLFIACDEKLRWSEFIKKCIAQNTIISELKSGCQRKPGKMLKMSTERGQQNKFILTS